ncbi:MAG: UDP-N-acetylmuramate dehydrogenase [Chitinispirillales bacterium]|jgi:UDP-N-acetylmuramate dehydrogenase|nr:UDP-N-acetylmuramate dehydrogenase [Chitinispirillales bacterium]
MLKIAENVRLADKTSYRIGGPARYYVEPRSESGIVEACRFAADNGLPLFVLGNGSNVLISDAGFAGLVVNLSKYFSALSWDKTTAFVLSGTPLDDLAGEAAERGCAGIECLSGIPGTVGGAVVMNAGAFDADVSKTLRSVRVLKASALMIETIPVKDLNFGYRTSALKGGGDVVLSATFDFTSGDAAQLKSLRDDIIAKRRAKQPVDSPSCGSVFKRPPDGFAGTLVESCGLKGFRIGLAEVSEKHANFIINTGSAKAEDVRALIRHVQQAVFEKHGVLLEPEVIFLGEFREPLYKS